MRAALLALVIAATPAFADTKAKSPEPVKAEVKPATCKKKVVGKGLDRHVVCEFEQEIVIPGEAPKPKVIIAPADGRKVVGRPKLTDPLQGLPRRRETSL